MLECLENKVIWKDACDTVQSGVFYINDLPGYPSGAFELLTNNDTQTAKDVYKKVQRRSKQAFKTAIETSMSERFQVQTIVSSIRTGTWQQPYESVPLGSGSKGECISLVSSDNLQVFIESVSLYVQGAVSEKIYFQDLETGQKITEVDFSATEAGFVTIPVNEVFTARKLFVYYDQSVISSRIVGSQTDQYYTRICKPCGCRATSSSPATSSLSSNMSYSDLSLGGFSSMIINYSLQCGLDRWICQNANRLAPLYMYWLGIELATEILASPRVNEVTLQDPEKIDAFAAYCNTQYEAGLKQLSKGAQIKDSVCVPCTPKVQKVFNLP